MDYKKIIKSQKVRMKILKNMDFIPDKLMVTIQYYLTTGRVLNLKNPRRYTEKLQWYKLYYHNPLMTIGADKYSVREYVKSKGLEDILVPLFGVYENANEIDFDDLPSEFVLKTTNGSHTNILCKDKKKLNKKDVIKQLNTWLNTKREKLGREWAYYDIAPRIISEMYLPVDKNKDLIDYKFFCFNGKPICLYVISERFLDSGEKLAVYDLEFNKISVKRSGINQSGKQIEKPKNFNKMIEIAKILSKDFPHVRVDLYNIDGKIYFGELTFYNGSGYIKFEPDEFDYYLGENFELPKKH